MRMVFFLAAFVFLIGAVAPANELTPEEKYKEIQKQLKESKQKLQQTKVEQQEVLGKLAVIRKELKKTTQTLNKANTKIKVNESQSIALSSEILERSKILMGREQKLKRRVREIYKSSGLNYLELLVTSHSMADFFNRLYFFSKIISQDADLVLGVREDVHFVRRKKRILEDKTQEIRELAKVVAVKKEEYTAKEEEKKSLYKSLEQRKAEYEAQIAELEKSSLELEKMIMQSVAARKGQGVNGSGSFAWPLQGRLTSMYGYRRHPFWGGRSMHTGIDIANKHGTPIKAADGGEVIFAGWWDGYGKAVVIDHGKGFSTVYGHLSKIYASVGLAVDKGQTIGLVGSTGYSTGPHLHFEIRKNGKPVNPMGFLK
ncbi:MAG: peptidoglycan DD-metalloendopeptidase family protein [Candidatus Margulisbacteria bacterium]|nr:peptidoglycan DD-metalloendopeptidase family protein [Candidatus Margulisiibacteriota bacterium]